MQNQSGETCYKFKLLKTKKPDSVYRKVISKNYIYYIYCSSEAYLSFVVSSR